jgi:imidazolonepropionase-like amidohydrolase
MKTFVSVLSGLLLGASAQLAHGAGEDRWLLTGTKVYVSPDAPPMNDAWVLVRGGKIEAVGDAKAARPRDVRSNQACSGGVVAAGFQNSHVHFTEAAFADAAKKPATDLERAVSRMLTQYGFTTVVDTASDVNNTVALRERIDSGEIKGPAILTAGVALYPENGIPFYIRTLPPGFLNTLPQPATVKEAVAAVSDNLRRGADATKLFVATPQGGGVVKRMAPDIVRAAAEESHKHGVLVLAHPTDPEGARVAVMSGVDILVHTTIDPPEGKWDAALIKEMIARHVSVVPTLKLWNYELDKWKAPQKVHEGAFADARGELQAFTAAGGQVLFGTDVGYMTDYDPTEDYVLMERAGFTPTQILASLTTAPAARWKASTHRGRVAAGLDADLTVLNADPAADVKAFASVKCTIRGGREVFTRKAGQ